MLTNQPGNTHAGCGGLDCDQPSVACPKYVHTPATPTRALAALSSSSIALLRPSSSALLAHAWIAASGKRFQTRDTSDT
jgi:hypothetical protein